MSFSRPRRISQNAVRAGLAALAACGLAACTQEAEPSRSPAGRGGGSDTSGLPSDTPTPGGASTDDGGRVEDDGTITLASERACDVIVAGGSTAALSAAIAAAEEGARTCLVEPTDWIGGQITASGVPAIDWAWHRVFDGTGAVWVDVARVARQPENMPPILRDATTATGNPGGCWVSRNCFEPLAFLDTHLRPHESRLQGTLTVLRNAVVKRVERDDIARTIRSVTVVQRTPREGVAAGGYDVLPSVDLADWYDERPSARYTKALVRLSAGPRFASRAVFIDATEWGELLALAGAPYVQGVEPNENERASNDRCGQAITFGFAQTLRADPIDEPDVQGDTNAIGYGEFTGRADAWPLIWRYRRLRTATANPNAPPSVGDVTLQNWGWDTSRKTGGNTYAFAPYLLDRASTDAQRADWRGGVDLAVFAAAERRAYGFHLWFRDQAPGIEPRRITLDRSVLGTAHGLSKLPYVRDSRRSIGHQGFVLTLSDLRGAPPARTGFPFPDRVATGAYAADLHPLEGCAYPNLGRADDVLPYFIPFRALTNATYDNLLVAGKTMAQTFNASRATRVHPVEWASGTAAGTAAAMMARSVLGTPEVLARIGELQTRVASKTPIDWLVDGVRYPTAVPRR
jgi:hypothetical protein